MTKQEYIQFLLDQLKSVVKHTSKKGRRVEDLKLSLIMRRHDYGMSSFLEAIDEAIAAKQVVAVRIKYGPNYKSRPIVAAADSVSFVGEDNLMIYLASHIPNSVKRHLEQSAKGTLAVLATLKSEP